MTEVAGSPAPSLSIQLVSFAAADPGGWRSLFDRAQVADRAGVDRVVVSDHVVFGEHLDEYTKPAVGGMVGAKQPTGPDGHWLEPMVLLSMLAGFTHQVRLGTSVLQAALRRPTVLAKEAATLDVLSGGRLDLGVGLGWQREEYEACGLDFTRRGDLLNHTLAVCQTLWREQAASFRDAELQMEGIHMMPKPSQPGGVPIWVGGRINPRTIERIVRFGQGWIPWGNYISDPTPGIQALQGAFEDAGRDPSDLLVQGVLPVVSGSDGIDLDATMAGVPKLVQAGITDFRFRPQWTEDAGADTRALEAVVGAFRAAVGRPSA